MSDATIYSALAAANKELTNPVNDKRAKAGQYEYAYASLDTVLAHVRPVLAKHGVFVFQDVTNGDEHVQIVTTLAHESGDTLAFGPLQWPNTTNPQHLGGLISYGRRYALLAALGIAAGDDDDAQAATGDRPKTTAGKAVQREGRLSDKQLAFLVKLVREQKISEPTLSDFCKDRFGFELPVEGLDHLSFDHANLIIDALVKTKDKPVTRVKPTAPVDDAWTVDPETGEIAQ